MATRSVVKAGFNIAHRCLTVCIPKAQIPSWLKDGGSVMVYATDDGLIHLLPTNEEKGAGPAKVREVEEIIATGGVGQHRRLRKVRLGRRREVKKMMMLVLLGFLWSDFASAQVDCSVADHTAMFQTMVNTQTFVSLKPGSHWCIRGNTGVTVPSGVTIFGNGSTLQIKPGCAIPQVCKILQTLPLSSDQRFFDLTLVGDLTPAIGFQVLLRIDQATNVLVDHVTFLNARTDGFQVTGNTTPAGNVPSRNITFRNVHSKGCSRNGMSAVNVDGLLIVDSLFEDVNGIPVGPGAGGDFEPNFGGIVNNVFVIRSVFRRAKVGIYDQAGLGLPGTGRVYQDVIIEDASIIGFVLNCVSNVAIQNVSITNAPLGFTSGGFGPPRNCVSRNVFARGLTVVNSITPSRFAGTFRPVVIDSSHTPTQVSPGTGIPGIAGDVLFVRNGAMLMGRLPPELEAEVKKLDRKWDRQ